MNQEKNDTPSIESHSVDFDPFADGEVQRTLSTTESQKEIWLAVQLGGNEANCAYNQSDILTIHGPLNIKAMKRALQEVVSRHEALRGTISPDGNTLSIAKEIRLEIPSWDIASLERQEKDSKIQELIKQEAVTPFDIEHGPLFRAKIIKLSNEVYCIVFTCHHIILDGWSAGVIIRELDDLYLSYAGSRVPKLGKPAQFSDYVKYLSTDEHRLKSQKSERFWIDQFQDEIPVLQLPTTYKRPLLRTFQADAQDFEIDQNLLSGLKKMSSLAKCSLTVIMMAGLKILLHRLTGQNSIVVGLPAAGQATSGMKTLVGHCVNILPVKSRINGEETVFDYIKHLRSVMLDAYEHQDLTFGSLVQKLKIPRDAGRVPLVPILLNVDRGISDFSFGEMRASLKNNLRQFENFEWFLDGTVYDDKIVIECLYSSSLFDYPTMKSRLEEFATVLSEMTKNPHTQIKALNILPAEEYDLQINLWNKTAFEYPKNESVHSLFKKRANLQADKIALTFKEKQLSYGELNERSDELALYLKNMKIGAGSLVGIFMDRSVEMVIALLGVLKAGAAYVPLDPDYPAERIRYMIHDAGIQALLTQNHLQMPVGGNQIPIVYLDIELSGVCADSKNIEISAENDTRENDTSPEDPAYVIYTSGSTGKPKGVVIPQRAFVNFLVSTAQTIGIDQGDTLLAVTTLSFDIAGLELFLPLLYGATVRIVTRDTATDAIELINEIRESKATIMQATPGTWRMMLEAGWDGSDELKILCGGEPFPRDLASRLTSKNKEVWNMYGPTETTIWSTCYRIDDPDGKILIGRPLGNTKCYVLDPSMQPCPIGVPGELYIGGQGVATEYHNRPDLTAKVFLANPFAQGEKIYKTGDMVRFLTDGNIEFFNRIDNQVKIRGFRIELGEIENRLKEHESVKQATAVVKEMTSGDVRLAAFIVPTDHREVIGTELRKHLRLYLPEYMIPQHFIQEDKLPLTPAGKIDRGKLEKQFDIGGSPDEEVIEPSTESEKYLADVWKEMLSINTISTHDNFFNIGGHSLLSMRVISKIGKETGIRISPRDMLLNTLAQIAFQYDFSQAISQKSNTGTNGIFRSIKNRFIQAR